MKLGTSLFSAEELAALEGDYTPFAGLPRKLVVSPKELVDEPSILDKLKPLSNPDYTSVAIHKTVEMFSGITKRKLWVKNQSGAIASTDGHEIVIDMKAPYAYQLTEHELSHVLFKSSVVAKERFAQEYQARLITAANKQGVLLAVGPVTELVHYIINLVEDHRVDSLWALIYPGSAKLLRDRSRLLMSKHVSKAHDSLLVNFACVHVGLDVPAGRLSKFKTIFEKALSDVERKGFLATLIVSRSLIVSLTEEIMRETAASLSSKGKPSSSLAADVGSKDNQGQAGQPGGAGKKPPEDKAKEYVKALEKLLDASYLPQELWAEANDLTSPRYPQHGVDAEAEKLVRLAMDTSPSNSSKIDELLEKAEEDMQKIVADTKLASSPQVGKDEWLRKDAMAKVNFHDIVQPNFKDKNIDRATADSAAVRRLRSNFMRLLGSKRSSLDDSGLEIDMQALIDRRVSKQAAPCFKAEKRGNGFKALLLIDRSSSMKGACSENAERACRIIGSALKFPFVSTEVWGFHSLAYGQVDIDRFKTADTVYSSKTSYADGGTPLHIAIKLAARQLDHGKEDKHLLVLTDGFPHFTRKDGTRFPESQLQDWVRAEVLRARKRGIQVTCLMIGTSVPEKRLSFMFGQKKNWAIIKQDSLTQSLVSSVASTFSKYLKSR